MLRDLGQGFRESVQSYRPTVLAEGLDVVRLIRRVLLDSVRQCRETDGRHDLAGRPKLAFVADLRLQKHPRGLEVANLAAPAAGD